MSDLPSSTPRWPLFVGALLLAAILVTGAVLRFAALDRRPMHHDEGNQAIRCQPLVERGEYTYTPEDHHGPTLYYAALPVLRAACGRDFAASSENHLRAVTAVAGLLAILFIWPLRGVLGPGGVLAAMACAALSPGLVYYSRFFIQEMLLVAATIALLASAWRYTCRPTASWAAAMGASAAFMLATKETAVLTFAACVLGAASVLWRRWRPSLAHLGWGLAGGTLVLVLFYSSFGTHWEGVVGLAKAIPFYLHRAGGGGHDHNVWFYLEPLLRYEWPILILALAGIAAAIIDRSTEPAALFRRGLAIAALVLTGFYFAIPYKTPWCLMTSLALFAICAGQGVAWLAGMAMTRRAVVVGIITAALLIPLATTAWRLSFSTRHFPSRWGYVETSRDLLHLVERMHGLAAVHPDGYGLTVVVASTAEDIWPLPWYLRRFTRVGYWMEVAQVPATLRPDVVIGDPEVAAPVAARIPGERVSKLFGLRSEVFLGLDCQTDLWRRMLEAQSPTRR